VYLLDPRPLEVVDPVNHESRDVELKKNDAHIFLPNTKHVSRVTDLPKDRRSLQALSDFWMLLSLWATLRKDLATLASLQFLRNNIVMDSLYLRL